MASARGLVAWKKIVFFALLLLAFKVSARELVGTNNVVARMAREMAMETNGVMSRRLIARQLDSTWKGNYFPPPPRYPPRPPPPYSS